MKKVMSGVRFSVLFTQYGIMLMIYAVVGRLKDIIIRGGEVFIV